MRTFKFAFLQLVVASLLGLHAEANNIAVNSAVLTGQNTSAGADHANNYCLVRFNLNWENSWRSASGPSNWDAAYIFVKYRIGTSDYSLSGASSSGSVITVGSTSGLRVGMTVEKASGTGTLPVNTAITAINSATTFTINTTPSVALSAATLTITRVWQHAYLNNSGHNAGSGTAANVRSALYNEGVAFNQTTNPALGAYIYRNASGSGTFSVSNAHLRWNYGANGVLDNDIVDIKVFAIEMVYVPQGSFYVGDGRTSGFNASYKNGNTNNPLQITSEGAITLGGTTAGNLATQSGDGVSSPDFNSGSTKTLPAAFPKGYNGFYCMKYELTQKQTVDFINTLDRYQQGRLLQNSLGGQSYSSGVSTATSTYVVRASSTVVSRNYVRIAGSFSATGPLTSYCDADGDHIGNEISDGQSIPCALMGWWHAAAFLDWAGLRPMTDLEFEKACRGPVYPVTNEYAWGSTSLTISTGISNSGSANETGTGTNPNNSSTAGPFRAGCFASAANASRVVAGASYWGIMELSGSLLECTVGLGNATDRNFTGEHGNGSLNWGLADVSTWPHYSGGIITYTSNGCSRGGYSSNDTYKQISDRIYANSNVAASGITTYSGRGIRTLPVSAEE